ncbi:prepilin-type N-terminal cleavage/methylation domain-containing protein [Candidatus Saccharibacteria bacterium]|nr:prepilin-type N-terminal cleavage/methylation domain-containing protein [Candidatus Saccharibacteria bacterium]
MKKGFTLIELLVVIAIIAILAAVVFVALNPVQRFQDARNSTRISDVNSLLTAIHESIVDNGGALPTGLSLGMAETQLGTAAACTVTDNGNACGTVAACVDLTTPLAQYLASVPVDPQGSAARTSYSVTVDANSIVTVRSCDAEGGATIQVSR